MTQVQIDVDLLRGCESDIDMLKILLEPHGFTTRSFETFAEFEQRDSDASCIITHSTVPDQMFDSVLVSLRPLGIPVIYLSTRAEPSPF